MSRHPAQPKLSAGLLVCFAAVLFVATVVGSLRRGPATPEAAPLPAAAQVAPEPATAVSIAQTAAQPTQALATLPQPVPVPSAPDTHRPVAVQPDEPASAANDELGTIDLMPALALALVSGMLLAAASLRARPALRPVF